MTDARATRRLRRALGLVCAVGLALRLAFSLGYWTDKPLTHDEQEYLALALNLTAGRGFTTTLPGAPEGPTVQHFSRAPLYPWALSLILHASHHPTDRLPAAVPRAVKVVQSVFGAAGVLLVGGLAFQAAGATAAVLASSIAALYLPLVWISAYALSEALYTPLILAALWMLGPVHGRAQTDRDRPGAPRPNESDPDTEARPQVVRLVVSGVLLALAALTRPGSLVVALFIALWLVVRRGWAAALIVVVTMVAVVAPWTIRNYVTYERFIAIAAEGGVTFWTGNHPESPGEGDLAANPHLRVRQLELLARHPGLTPEQMEPVYYREALVFITSQPAHWLSLCARKLFYTFAAWGPSYRLHSARYFWGTVIPYGMVFVLAVLSWTAGRRVGWPPEPLLVAAVATVATAVAFFPQERFRIPVLDPTYIVSAALWLAASVRWPASLSYGGTRP